jgi:hypothetical protein
VRAIPAAAPKLIVPELAVINEQDRRKGGSDSSLSGHPEAKPALRSAASHWQCPQKRSLRIAVPNVSFNLHANDEKLIQDRKGINQDSPR